MKAPRLPVSLGSLPPPIPDVSSDRIPDPRQFGLDSLALELPTGGEAAANQRLERFLTIAAARYHEDRDRLYHNKQDGTFEEVGAEILPYTPWHSRGAVTADLDQDGHLDLLCLDDAGGTLSEAKQLHANTAASASITTRSSSPTR